MFERWVVDAWTHRARPKCPKAQTHVVRLLSRQKKKLVSSNLYIKQSIFRVTIKLRTLPFLQSFRSFNLIEILAVTRNRRPRQRLLFAVQQFFPWTALTQRRLHRESTSICSIIELLPYLLFWNVKYILRARHLMVDKKNTEMAFEHNQGSAPLNSGSSLSNCLGQDPPSHVQLPCLLLKTSPALSTCLVCFWRLTKPCLIVSAQQVP